MKILVCEDDFMMLKTIELKLKRDGYDIVIAKDGKEAANLLKDPALKIDMVVTDLLMPFLSGLELINLLRNELKSNIPLIVLSKVGNEDTVLQAFELGADEYITKPFSPNELSIRVKRVLMKK